MPPDENSGNKEQEQPKGLWDQFTDLFTTETAKRNEVKQEVEATKPVEPTPPIVPAPTPEAVPATPTPVPEVTPQTAEPVVADQAAPPAEAAPAATTPEAPATPETPPKVGLLTTGLLAAIEEDPGLGDTLKGLLALPGAGLILNWFLEENEITAIGGKLKIKIPTDEKALLQQLLGTQIPDEDLPRIKKAVQDTLASSNFDIKKDGQLKALVTMKTSEFINRQSPPDGFTEESWKKLSASLLENEGKYSDKPVILFMSEKIFIKEWKNPKV